MVKHFCDICGKEIETESEGSWYKVKKETYSWHERWWQKMYVHDDCWRNMCRYIRERRADNERKAD